MDYTLSFVMDEQACSRALTNDPRTMISPRGTRSSMHVEEACNHPNWLVLPSCFVDKNCCLGVAGGLLPWARPPTPTHLKPLRFRSVSNNVGCAFRLIPNRLVKNIAFF